MRKVRIGATVGGAFDIVLNFRVLVGCAGGWSILLLAAMLAEWAFPLRMLWFGRLGGAAVTLLAFAGIAVNVHRRVLLGESPRLLRLGPSEMRYAWRGIVMGFFLAAMLVVLTLLYYLGSWLLGAGLPGRMLIGFLGACAALFVVIELIGALLVLPAAAVGDAGFGWDDAWKAAGHNRLAILAVCALCSLPLSLPAAALFAVEPWLASWPGGSLATQVAHWIIAVAQSILGAAWLSLVFSGLVDGNADFAVVSSDGGET